MLKISSIVLAIISICLSFYVLLFELKGPQPLQDVFVRCEGDYFTGWAERAAIDSTGTYIRVDNKLTIRYNPAVYCKKYSR